MKKMAGLIALYWTMLMVLGCSSADKTRPPEKQLTVSALSGLLRGKNPPRVLCTGSLLQWRDEHIPASRCVPCDATEAVIKPLLQDRDTSVVLYGKEPLTREVCPLISRLDREGKPPLFVLSGGLAAWKKNGLATESMERIPRLAVPGIYPRDMKEYAVEGKAPLILDIRSAVTFKVHPVTGALNIPLTQLHERYGEIPLDRPVVVVDDDGGETLLAASYLLRKGVPVAARIPNGIKDLSAHKTEGGDRR
jgi:rhodanese-related sulfurtransferase